MKNITLFCSFCFLFLFFNLTNAQQMVGGGEFRFNENNLPCLTEDDRQNIVAKLQENVQRLNKTRRVMNSNNSSSNTQQFSWPVQKNAGLAYNDAWSISNYVDHNTGFPNQITDYNCGSKSYDTNAGYNHKGVDIFTWPFSWNLMDTDAVEVIAAADGQIIGKDDGNFDRSCSSNNNQWNAVYVQHGDGSIAWYGHLKDGSLTTKNVGDYVNQNEFLGVVGSSGNSTGPHLHFEVYTNINLNTLIDPYVGACNSWNSTSWWETQKPYMNPKINALLTHHTLPVFPSCPTTEIINASNQFSPNQDIYFGLYLRDQEPGTSVNLKLIKPDNSILYNWDFTIEMNYPASYWFWNFDNLSDNGQWKWEATYQGETVTHVFNVGTMGIDDKDFMATSVYPNPTKDQINISSSNKVTKVTVIDILGRKIKTETNLTEGVKQLNFTNYSKGIYFLHLKGDTDQQKIIKVIKE